MSKNLKYKRWDSADIVKAIHIVNHHNLYINYIILLSGILLVNDRPNYSF